MQKDACSVSRTRRTASPKRTKVKGLRVERAMGRRVTVRDADRAVDFITIGELLK
jgi:hypothetical protein